jgi:hypothetical protein
VLPHLLKSEGLIMLSRPVREHGRDKFVHRLAAGLEGSLTICTQKSLVNFPGFIL